MFETTEHAQAGFLLSGDREMALFQIKVKGLSEIRAALRRLPGELSRKAVRGAAQKSLGLFRDEARRRAPKRTGALRRAITAAAYKGRGDDIEGRIYVSSRVLKIAKTQEQRRVFYAHLVEFGFTARDGTRVPGKGFMRAAFESKKDDVIDEFIQETRQRLAQAVRAAR